LCACVRLCMCARKHVCVGVGVGVYECACVRVCVCVCVCVCSMCVYAHKTPNVHWLLESRIHASQNDLPSSPLALSPPSFLQ
jgi:hypothetical protein